MIYVDINPDEAMKAIRSAFPTQFAKAKMLVQTEISRQWRQHQEELAKKIPYYSQGDDGTEAQVDGMSLQSAIIAVSERAAKRNGRL